MRNKFKMIEVLLVICILTILSGCNNNQSLLDVTTDKVSSSSSENLSDKYSTDYYEIEKDSNWKIQMVDEYTVYIESDNEIVGNITVYPQCEYTDSINAIISNIYGMHSYLKEEFAQEENNSNAVYCVVVGYQKSASEELSDKESANEELHYIYINKNKTIIDFYAEYPLVDENIRIAMRNLKLY
jgi:Zn ribbon nucleic-acid-binding protein